MKTFITALVLIVALASGISIIAVAFHDPMQIDHNTVRPVGHQGRLWFIEAAQRASLIGSLRIAETGEVQWQFSRSPVAAR